MRNISRSKFICFKSYRPHTHKRTHKRPIAPTGPLKWSATVNGMVLSDVMRLFVVHELIICNGPVRHPSISRISSCHAHSPPPFRPRLLCSYLAKSRPQPGCLPVTSSPPDSALTR